MLNKLKQVFLSDAPVTENADRNPEGEFHNIPRANETPVESPSISLSDCEVVEQLDEPNSDEGDCLPEEEQPCVVSSEVHLQSPEVNAALSALAAPRRDRYLATLRQVLTEFDISVKAETVNGFVGLTALKVSPNGDSRYVSVYLPFCAAEQDYADFAGVAVNALAPEIPAALTPVVR